MRLSRLLLCAAIWSAAGLPAAALDPARAPSQYQHDAWTTDRGLPQPVVNAIAQTRDGYLWIAAHGGLARFDGVRFVSFSKSNSAAFRNDSVMALAADADGSLWIGTAAGLLRHAGGGFTRWGSEQGLASEDVRAVLRDRRGELWVGTAGGGLQVLRRGRFRAIGVAEGLRSARVQALAEGKDGTLWVGTSGGLYRRAANPAAGSDRFEPIGAERGLDGAVVRALWPDRSGALWIATDGSGLLRLGEGMAERFGAAAGLPSEVVRDVREDRHGNLWIATSAGLCRWSGGRIEPVPGEILSNATVRALFEDAEGNLWAGTNAGVDRLRDGPFTNYGTRQGLPHDFVRPLLAGEDGVWIGTFGGGLALWRDGAIVQRLGVGDGLASDFVIALARDAEGTLWAGTTAGLTEIRAGRAVRTIAVRDGLTHAMVRALAVDRDGSLWIGTSAGLNRLAAGALTSYRLRDGMTSEFVMTLAQTRDGALWIGTDGAGLLRLQSGRFEHWGVERGLSNGTVYALYEDGEGVLWIGTNGGLNRLAGGKLGAVGTQHGLFDDVAFAIVPGAGDELWMTCNRGIYRASRRELAAVAEGRGGRIAGSSYGRLDGMPTSQCSGISQPAAARSADGRLWFPTVRGVAVLDPRRLATSVRAPAALVEELAVDGLTRPLAGAIDIAPGAERFEVRFTAPLFSAPERLRFEFRLAGLDDDWVDAGSERAAHFTNLRPGRYRFEVRAAESPAGKPGPAAVLSFRLRPRFYQTLPFFLVGVVAVVSAGAGSWGVRVRRQRARERELLALVEARTAELRLAKERTEGALEQAHHARAEAETQREIAQRASLLKTELLGIAAHDLKDPLQSVLGFATLVAEDVGMDARLARRVSSIQRSSQQMLALVTDLLDTAAIDSGRVELHPRRLDLREVAKMAIASNREAAEAKRQKLELEVSAEACVVEGDEGRLLEVANNLVSNAVKYSPPEATIRVGVRGEADGARLTVRDGGPGLSPEDFVKLFGRFQRLSARPTAGEPSTGLGLSIAKHLVELHSGRIWADNHPQGGSVFTVELPWDTRGRVEGG